MPNIISAFYRHADYQQLPDTPSAHQPFSLTDKGKQQAIAAGQELQQLLQNKKWLLYPVIDCSHLLRAWQTASLMMQQLSYAGLSIAQCPDLAERSVGLAANLTSQQIAEALAADPRYQPLPENWKSDSYFRLPYQGAESLMQSGQRVADHLQQSMQQLVHTSEQNVVKLFIGHGASFRHAAYHLGVLQLQQIQQFSMFHASGIFMEWEKGLACRHIAGEWKVRSQYSRFQD